MGVLRTVVAMGALSISVPLMAQNGRYGWDRARVERSGDVRGKGSDSKGSGRVEDRKDVRNDNRTQPRSENRVSGRDNARVDARPGNNGRDSRYERREAPRVVVRPPDVPRYDRRDVRVNGRYIPYGGRVVYRYGDSDFRHRDLLTITAWFRGLGPSRMSVYGSYGRGWPGEQPVFRPGLYLSMAVFSRLDVLPYELEFELGELPWFLERRIYGNTVLVIDVRTRMVVDLYDIDY